MGQVLSVAPKETVRIVAPGIQALQPIRTGGAGRQEVKVDLHPLRVYLEKATDLRCALDSRQTGPLIIPTKKTDKTPGHLHAVEQ